MRKLVPLLCILAALSCSRPRDGRDNVVLILVDTLRQDHVGAYGYPRDTTPAIDALAADAVRFERAYAVAPWTMPTVASMFTGLYPGRHRVTTINQALPAEVTTIAEILADQGYATAGVVSHTLLDRRHRFDQGFAEYIEVLDQRKPHEAVTTNDVTDAVLGMLAKLEASEEPFFLFVHYFDPHYNYKRHPEVGFAAESAGRLSGDEAIEDLYEVMEDITAEELALVEAIYDEEIRHTDNGIGRVLEELRSSGRFDDSWIVVTSDHGEEFMAHGNIGHTITLFEELVKVPLIVRPPAYLESPRVVTEPVSLVSLTPTLLDALGVESEPVFQAESFLPLVTRAGEGVGVVYLETDQLVNKRAAIVGKHKIVRDEQTGVVELYDIVADPDEQADLAAAEPDRVAALLEVLDERIRWSNLNPVEANPVTLTEEQLEQLKSLGYVGD
jgi:arylsulfatase A-like enzyme